MRKRYSRLWSAALVISLLTAIPSYGVVATVPPFQGVQNGSSQTGSSGGPGAADNSDNQNNSDNPNNPNNPNNSGNSNSSGLTGPESGTSSGPSQVAGTGASVQTVAQPEIQSEGAVLMDAATGTVLYSKNGDQRFYPASITKLMTALIVAEKCSLDDTVTYSKQATTNLESGAVSLGLVEGDKLTVRQSLYGLMLRSANEVANGLAEHVSGSQSAFADLMNSRAAQLGCTGTHFVNANGLNNSNHYTTPKDMALIAKAAFQNSTVRTVSSTLSYEIPATKNAAARKVSMGHKMLYPSDARYYSGIIGGKTGYTSLAGNTLVTAVEKDGVRLIAVIMKSKSTHYADTKALFDYGFALKNGNSSTAKWEKSGSTWYFTKENGTKASNEWLKIDGADYWFDSNGEMATGWRQFSNGSWYYFRSSGAMATNYWAQANNQWFYLSADGTMLKNGVTPDGYTVDSNGVWLQ